MHLGTGGTVLNTLDLKTGEKRLTKVRDVAAYARMTDALDNIAFFVINYYPNDLPAEEVDINRFYHTLANTSKHIMGGIYTMEGLRSVIDMAEEIAGSREKLLERPFVSFIILMMSPLVMEVTYTDFLIEVARRGLPVTTPSEPLAGSTAPLAGIAVLGVIIGARVAYVLTNWPVFAANPVEIIRVEHGELAFHGGLLGGIVCCWVYCRIKRLNLSALLDLAVPGIAVGIMVVRIANIFNQEILGRETVLFLFERHPTQIYGSLIGLSLLLIHNFLAHRGEREPGNLFWHFVLYYTFLRGFIEETFRDNPLLLWGYVNEAWGFGLFTALHLLTPALALLAWWMIRRTKGEGRGKDCLSV